MAEPLLSREEERRGIALARRGSRSARDLTELFDRVRSRVVERVAADDRLRERRDRLRLVGVDYDEAKPEPGRGDPRRLGHAHYYDHDAGTAVRVTVDLRSGQVVSIDERRGVHLRPSADEIERARSLVLESELGRQLGGRETSAVAFPGRTVHGDDPTWSHRRIELHLWSTGSPPQRLVSAVVNLTDGQVLPFDEDRRG